MRRCGSRLELRSEVWPLSESTRRLFQMHPLSHGSSEALGADGGLRGLNLEYEGRIGQYGIGKSEHSRYYVLESRVVTEEASLLV